MEDLYTIIEGCKRKDPACQEKLYRHYYPALFTLCKTLFSEKHDIISALNNGMLRVFANIHQYNASKGNFYGWMHAVVRNAALTFLRDSKKFRAIEITNDVEEAFIENPFKDFNWQELFIVLEKLPTDTRLAVVLFYIEEQSVKETAALLGMKEGTVKWHLSEGRKKLRILLKPDVFSER